MRATDIRLHRYASRIEDLLPEGLPEVVVAGRSNVGKSSLMNALTGVRGLARAGRRPGTTQAILWFSVDDRLHLVDLPGYGFARAPEAIRSTWGGWWKRTSPTGPPCGLSGFWSTAGTRRPNSITGWSSGCAT